jgi:ADP-ribose pyrophosphatase
MDRVGPFGWCRPSQLEPDVSPTFARRLADYLALQTQRPHDFTGPEDGVRIALDPAEIELIETVVGDRYEARGLPRAWAEVGVAYQDPYLRLLRDAVVFPGGNQGVHHRVLANSDPSGVAVLPLLGEQIVLIRHFRHPSRRWHWEIPRGGVEPGMTVEETARTELGEEIGATLEQLVPLGMVNASTALISGAVALFLGRVHAFGAPQLNEGIAAIRTASVTDVEAMIAASEITDSITLAAFLHARLKRFI